MILFIVVLVLGVNFTLWGAIGLVRIVDDRIFSRRPRRTAAPSSSPASVDVTEVALLIPAHNEELVLGRTVASAAALLPVENIYIVSDGSHDATDAIAWEAGRQCAPAGARPGKGVGADRRAGDVRPRLALQGGVAARRRHRAAAPTTSRGG